jgi:hypothetical protein
MSFTLFRDEASQVTVVKEVLEMVIGALYIQIKTH